MNGSSIGTGFSVSKSFKIKYKKILQISLNFLETSMQFERTAVYLILPKIGEISLGFRTSWIRTTVVFT
jgi:hypothetical protein